MNRFIYLLGGITFILGSSKFGKGLKKRAEEIKGERLDKIEEKRIENESQAITVKNEVHKEGSTTGGANKTLSKADLVNSKVNVNVKTQITKKSIQKQLDNLPDGLGKNYTIRQNDNGKFSIVRKEGNKNTQNSLANNEITPLKVSDKGNIYTPDTIKKPQGTENHHFVSDKNSQFSEGFDSIASKYDLDLNGDWNKEILPHSRRHTDKYHKFVQENMEKAANEAGNNTEKFLELFEEYVKKPIRENPDLMYNKGWE